eukprot:1300788-Rhodomonas_salina.2
MRKTAVARGASPVQHPCAELKFDAPASSSEPFCLPEAVRRVQVVLCVMIPRVAELVAEDLAKISH